MFSVPVSFGSGRGGEGAGTVVCENLYHKLIVNKSDDGKNTLFVRIFEHNVPMRLQVLIGKGFALELFLGNFK